MISNFKSKTMPSYCLKCKKTTGIINPRVSKIKSSKKSKFIKQDAKVLLIDRGNRTHLIKMPILGDALF